MQQFFNQKNTLCKCIVYVHLYVFIVPESLLQQTYLKKSELKKIFSEKVQFAVTEKITLKSRALLQQTSIVSNFVHPKHITVKIIDKLPMKSFMPEPQNNPYWIVKEAGHIHVYRGCSKDLNEFAVGRWEVDFFPLKLKRK